MNQYYYHGLVKEFDKVVDSHWEGTTYAISEKKARCNLAYQFKKEHGKCPSSKITLPGKLELIE